MADIMDKLDKVLSEAELEQLYKHFDELFLDFIECRKAAMELDYVKGWCQQYQEDHGIQFTSEEKDAFIAGWQDGFNKAMDDLDNLITDNGIADSTY